MDGPVKRRWANPNIANTWTADQTLDDGVNIPVGTTTGTEIGTTASQKIGFFGITPVVQQNVPLTSPSVQNVIDALVALGLVEQSD